MWSNDYVCFSKQSNLLLIRVIFENVFFEATFTQFLSNFVGIDYLAPPICLLP